MHVPVLDDRVAAALNPFCLGGLTVQVVRASPQSLQSLNLDHIYIMGACTLSQLAALGHVGNIIVAAVTRGVGGAVVSVADVSDAPARATYSFEIVRELSDACISVVRAFPLLRQVTCARVTASTASLRQLGPLISTFHCTTYIYALLLCDP